MAETTYIEIRLIHLKPELLRPHATDELDVFAYLHCYMRDPEKMRPLRLQKDESAGGYIVVCDGTAYDWEVIHLKTVRACGISCIPCLVIESDPPDDEPPDSPISNSPPPIPPAQPSSADPPSQSDIYDRVLAALLPLIGRWTRGVAKRSKPGICRAVDDKDWAQEILIVLSNVLRKQPATKKWEDFLKSPDAIRRLVWSILKKLVAQAAQQAAKTESLDDQEIPSGRSIIEELVKSEEQGNVLCAAAKAHCPD